MIVGEAGREAIVQPRGVESPLDLRRDLGADVVVADVGRHESRNTAEPLGAPSGYGIEGARSAAGLTVSGAELHLAPLGVEVLVRHDPGAADLRIHLQAEARTKGGVTIDADAGGKEVLV